MNGEISVLKDKEVTNPCMMICRTSREIARPAIVNPVAGPSLMVKMNGGLFD
jgi:hypothetical protein